MPYKCLNCKKKFYQPHIIRTSYEDYYGVDTLFRSRTSLDLEVCPYCNDEELEELEDYDDDEIEGFDDDEYYYDHHYKHDYDFERDE